MEGWGGGGRGGGGAGDGVGIDDHNLLTAAPGPQQMAVGWGGGFEQGLQIAMGWLVRKALRKRSWGAVSSLHPECLVKASDGEEESAAPSREVSSKV